MPEDFCRYFGHLPKMGLRQFKWIPATSAGLRKNYQSMHVHMWPVGMDNKDANMVLRTTQGIKDIMCNT